MDTDKLLQNALKSEAKPDPRLLSDVKFQIRKKENDMKQMKRPYTKVAVLVAAVLVLTTSALAASVYLGSFDRLRGIVGEERAEILQPIEFVTPPQPLEHETQQPEPQPTQNIFYAEGIRVELVAVGVFDNVVDIYVMMEDLMGTRLDNYFQVEHIVTPVGAHDISMLSTTPQIIDRTDGIVTIRSREIFSESVAGMDLRYSLRGITYNMSSCGRSPDFRDLRLDFPNVAEAQTLLFRPGLSPGRGGSGNWTSVMHDEIDALFEGYGFPVLQPHALNFAVDIGNETAIISNMGFVEDRLHVQIYYPTVASRDTQAFMLSNIHDETRTMSFGFIIDDDGNPVQAELGPDARAAIQYHEFIFFDVDYTRLDGFRMYGGSILPEPNNLDLNWSVTFSPVINESLIVSHGVDIEVRVTPFLIQVVLPSSPPPGTMAPDMTIHIADGAQRVINGTVFNNNFFYDLGENPVSLEDVVGVEIDGELINLTNG